MKMERFVCSISSLMQWISGSGTTCVNILLLTLFVHVCFAPATLLAQQVADTLFDPKVTLQTFNQGEGPVVLIDEAHHNFHTMEGRYLVFARLLNKDGYVVKPQIGKFTHNDLDRARVLVISNALAKENVDNWKLPTPSAFDSVEISIVKDWVSNGGSLWLIADHMPFPGAADKLAREFGIHMENGFAFQQGTYNGRIVYAREDGSLTDHPITRGRNSGERINTVVSFTGQAFSVESAAETLMIMRGQFVLLKPEVAWQFSNATPRLDVSGMLQGAVLHFGKGRIAVFGEAAMFSAQVSGPQRTPMGMNDPTAPDNAQFMLNVAHWLTGLL